MLWQNLKKWGERDHKESTLILELIRENLDLWKRHDGELVYFPNGDSDNGELLLSNGSFASESTTFKVKNGTSRKSKTFKKSIRK